MLVVSSGFGTLFFGGFELQFRKVFNPSSLGFPTVELLPYPSRFRQQPNTCGGLACLPLAQMQTLGLGGGAALRIFSDA